MRAVRARPFRRSSRKRDALPHGRPALPCPRPIALATACAFAAGGVAAQQAPQQLAQADAQRVEVIGATPLPGTSIPKDRVPSNVQTLGEGALRRLQSLNLPDAAAAALPGVVVNEVQGNPFQVDVDFRGFSASPLLGTPQGLSVFLDGVRVNEPFGDVVNWDLIPRAALADLTLLPGSNPLFGLNTLGGALSLRTKSGDTHPGTELSLEAGSFGRVMSELSHGRKLGEHGHLFIAASSFDERGWRDHSPSRVRQLFAKGGVRERDWEASLSLTHADNSLVGNGLLPEPMLAQRRQQVYTRPDRTTVGMTMLSFNGSVELNAEHKLSALAYVRRSNARTLNGDLNEAYDPPAHDEAGVENRSHTRQQGEGVALQSLHKLGAQQLTLGLSQDRARSRFRQTEAEGQLDAARRVVDVEDAETSAWISGTTRTTSFYAHDLIELRPDLQLTLAARWNDTRVRTTDLGRAQLGLSTNLDGEGRFRKLNPAVGMTWQATPALTIFGGFSQGNRAPSPIELGCSDPAQACVLPNALQSDPPLKQVVARTVELGARGSVADAPGGALRWNAAVFDTLNRDDLLFVSNGLARGYFKNFGRTQRRGLELGISQQLGDFGWSLSYAWLRATYRSAACIVAADNSSAQSSPNCPGNDEIEIRPGDRIPGLPAHTVKLGLDWQPSEVWQLGMQLRAQSGQYVRGNENNRHRPDGSDYFGAGRLGGFAVVDLTGRWRLSEHVELVGRIGNLFDRQYGSAGALGVNAFDAAGNLLAPADRQRAQFVGPGAPRAAWIGLKLQFGT